MKKDPYPNITKLGIKVYNEPTLHIKPNELKVALIKNNISVKKFSDLLGVHTGVLINGKCCSYPSDIEDVLVRMIEKRLTGTQLMID
jgi:hypothetical protein